MTNGREAPKGREGSAEGETLCDWRRGLLGKGDTELDFRIDEVIVNVRGMQL